MPENLQNHYLRPQIKKRYSALVMLILIIMLCAALRPEIYNCIIYRGSIYNADRGELTTWSSNQNNTTKSIPEGFYLADYLPRITKNQTLEFNRTLNCIDFKTLSNHRGMLFISGLYPTTDSCINFEIGLDQDGRAESYINTSNMLVMVWRNNDSYRLYSFWYSDKGLMKKRFLEIPAKDVMHNKIEFSIISDEDKRTNIIKYNDSLQLRTPYAYSSSREIPYSALSHPMIQINNRIYPNSTYCTLHIYRIEQRIPRKIITPCGTKAKNAFGLDGPHKLESIMNGINYMTNRGHVGTIWADVRYLNANNIPFIKNLLNNGWELGIHYSAELSKLPLKDAYSLMDSEYQIISDLFSTPPTTWCSLRNQDNTMHAIYAYDNLGMIWRNGKAGIHLIPNVGNLDNDTWNWWKSSANHSAIYPSFSHRLDEEPAIKYSIDYSKFKGFVDEYTNKNIQLVGFKEYYMRNINQKEADITILEKNRNYIIFSVKTNGYPCNINVFMENTSMPLKILDMTSGEPLSFDINDDMSVTFETMNRHTYNLSFKDAKGLT